MKNVDRAKLKKIVFRGALIKQSALPSLVSLAFDAFASQTHLSQWTLAFRRYFHRPSAYEMGDLPFWFYLIKQSAGDRTRTDTPSRTADFESAASTNFATPAFIIGSTA